VFVVLAQYPGVSGTYSSAGDPICPSSLVSVIETPWFDVTFSFYA
jgi:hypothetical protein